MKFLGLSTLLLASATPSFTQQQCDLIDFNFDQYAPGTLIDFIPPWDDANDLVQDTTIELEPNTGSPAIKAIGSFARLNVQGITFPSRYQISYDLTAFSEARFRMTCPDVIVPIPGSPFSQIVDDARLTLRFQPNLTAPIVTGATTGATLPIAAGVPMRVVIDIDTNAKASIYIDGELLESFPWSASPGPCTAPHSLFFNGKTAGVDLGVYIDNLCISSVAPVVGCNATNNSTGNPAQISAPGQAHLVNDTIQLEISNLPVAARTIFYTANSTTVSMPIPGAVFCLRGSLGRFDDSIQFANSDGIASYQVDLNQPVPLLSGGPTFVLAGQTWFYQGFYQENVGGAQVLNFSDAVGVTFLP